MKTALKAVSSNVKRNPTGLVADLILWVVVGYIFGAHPVVMLGFGFYLGLFVCSCLIQHTFNHSPWAVYQTIEYFRGIQQNTDSEN